MSDLKKMTKDSPSKGNKDDKTKQDQAKDSSTKSGTQNVNLDFLEADDDFEEFPMEEWDKEKRESAMMEDDEDDIERVNIWEDNWDDDNIEEDFSKQLKVELEKRIIM